MDTKKNVGYLEKLKWKSSFSRNDLLEAITSLGSDMGEALFKATLQKLLKSEAIVRVGRNAYCIPDTNVHIYNYNYSDLACEVAKQVAKDFPYLDFTIMEYIQLNAFVNHQLAHNIIFLSVEADLGNFVFDKLKEIYPGKVLIYPTPDIFHQYWYDGMIVIEKLVSEAPMGVKQRWHTRLEKLLVDVMTDPLLIDSISEAERPVIYENAFEQFIIDESCLFRYANRRGAGEKIRDFIKYKTTVKLKKV